MKPRKLNIRMSRSEFEDFCKSLENRDVEEFVAKFVAAHEGVGRDDTLSLALNRAMMYDRQDVVHKILYMPHTENILTIIDVINYSPIGYLIHFIDIDSMIQSADGSIFGTVLEYLARHKNTIPLVDLEGYDFLLTRAGVSLSRWEVSIDEQVEYFRRYFLDALYTKESLDALERTFHDTFDAATYIKDYRDKQEQSNGIGVQYVEKKQDGAADDEESEDSPGGQKALDGDGDGTVNKEGNPSIRCGEENSCHDEELSLYQATQSGGKHHSSTAGSCKTEDLKLLVDRILEWLEELPSWLQAYVMDSHPVQVLLESIRTQYVSSVLEINLFKEKIERMFEREHRHYQDGMYEIEEKAKSDHVLSSRPDDIDLEARHVDVMMCDFSTARTISVYSTLVLQEVTQQYDFGVNEITTLNYEEVMTH
ncbi:hypothetical protein EDM53_02250 [Rickettsiales endosymbiont of Peranema trichophorum]|uniref:hypothetical protein n=1 Tax=Rickettsiales endosymbiont of Peranema trichophorum TaxID=2486577 RepID=UPI00102301FD|nr:hypothetical protein [Rickettsiales endosymbiont of Peranema trichophorum]RZI47372.1 hypothetical protein EDM53_02250 [Rickettsiales endosymbiont of Peranema trichophorum]